MIFAGISNATKLGIEVGVATGLILAALGWLGRKASTFGGRVVETVTEVKGLLETDENGLGVMDRLASIDKLIAERTPIFDETRRWVLLLMEKADILVDRTETLTPNSGTSMHDQLGRLDAANSTAHPSRPARPVKKAAAKKAAPRRRS